MKFGFFERFEQSLAQLKPGSLKFEFPDSPEEMERAMLDQIRRTTFFLARVPGLAFFGVRVTEISARTCKVRLPFHWRTQNPFGSQYFAAQTAAAELSTGALILRAISGQPLISMLVIGVRGEFLKKAKSEVEFTCPPESAQELLDAVERVERGEAVELEMRSVGRLSDGTEVARFRFRWALKKREG